jgi:hypothetical protein
MTVKQHNKSQQPTKSTTNSQIHNQITNQPASYEQELSFESSQDVSSPSA